MGRCGKMGKKKADSAKCELNLVGIRLPIPDEYVKTGIKENDIIIKNESGGLIHG